MKKIEIAKTIGLIITIITMLVLIIYIFILKNFPKVDKDYQKLGLELDTYNIDYYTVYIDNYFKTYKVYKLNISGDKDRIRSELENSSLWTKNKFYEYIMVKFDEEINKERVKLDRDDLYYYASNGIHAIFDMRNAKLYYLMDYLYDEHKNYNTILGIEINDYLTREIYSVRGGPQNDGTDYYTYEFAANKGKEIIKILEQSKGWSKNKLEDKKLESFEYNKEVLNIENGYYYYKLVRRTSNLDELLNVTEETATGYEIGIYDAEKNMLYYYWTSY